MELTILLLMTFIYINASLKSFIRISHWLKSRVAFTTISSFSIHTTGIFGTIKLK